MNKLIEAVRWGVKEVDGERSIQLFDDSGNKLEGDNAFWRGNFYCYNNQLTSLEGAPKEVGGTFYCSNNQLTSLEGAPKEVGGAFYCSNNQLTSLEGAPKEVGGAFYCSNNQLTSLEGAPKEVGGSFYCSNNQLTSLEGAPTEVGGNFYCYDNQLTSLEGAPKEVGGSFYCSNNQLTSLEGAPKEYSSNVRQRIFEAKKARGYLLADEILQRIIKTREHGEYIVYSVKSIGSKKKSIVAQSGDNFSHGDTLKEAIDDLQYKISDRDTSEYKEWSINTKKSKADMIQAYRKITGACQYGTKSFVGSKEIKDELTVREVIEIAEGQFGHSKFKEFFNGSK